MTEAKRKYALIRAARRRINARGGSDYLNSLDESARAVLMQRGNPGGSQVRPIALGKRGIPVHQSYTHRKVGEPWHIKYDRMYRVRGRRMEADTRKEGIMSCLRICIDDMCHGNRQDTLCGGSYCDRCDKLNCNDGCLCDDCRADHDEDDEEYGWDLTIF